MSITATENGPLKVQGPFSLTDVDGNQYDVAARGESVFLCRCGGSKNKPFCDATHSKIGFQAAERAVAEADASA